jgi:ribosomal protein L11 methyltransferase
MKYSVVKINGINAEQLELLTAMLPEFGFEGMEEFENSLTAYSKETESDVESLRNYLKSIDLSCEFSEIPEQNWNAQWESNFDPVIIPGKIHVRAHFHPRLDGFEHEITITPKMSFGTGHHATTSMMMRTMMDLHFNDKSVLDFGTGTGILAILAAQKGSVNIIAIDNDEWSINNTIENAQMNMVSDLMDIRLADNLDNIPQSDIILANINKHVLIAHVNAIYRVLHPKGKLIISGLLKDDYEDIMTIYEPLFGTSIQVLEENGWICIVFGNINNS